MKFNIKKGIVILVDIIMMIIMTMVQSAEHNRINSLSPGIVCTSLGRRCWYVLKIPASEITMGACICTSSCPFRTLTPAEMPTEQSSHKKHL